MRDDTGHSQWLTCVDPVNRDDRRLMSDIRDSANAIR
jgi:hypothetical protein